MQDMESDHPPPTEASPLLPRSVSRIPSPALFHSAPAYSPSKADQALGQSPTLGDSLPYKDYTTIDWLRDLTKDWARARRLHARRGVRGRLARWFDQTQGWIAAALVGALTAVVGCAVDVSVATVSDWREGYCKRNAFLDRGRCCLGVAETDACDAWSPWVDESRRGGYLAAYAIYILAALLFGIIAGNVTLTTRSSLPAVDVDSVIAADVMAEGKTVYMAAGSGIPEIKSILSGFEIPHFLDLKVLVVKAVGATFAVSTGMSLGKEGPFVHIATCAGYLVASWFPKYRDNPRKMREMLSVACSAGLSVAFGAPIGGVLFSYEEISTYFPRRVLWRAFLCSLVGAIALKALNPTGTGKLVLLQTNYHPMHYLVFVFLGVCGGVFGGVFCQANFLWSKRFRTYDIVRNHPVWEVCGVILVTALLQYPNVLTRDTGEVSLSKLLVDCKNPGGEWICEQERSDDRTAYMLQLAGGAAIKLLLTTVTFGCKVPSGIIIPALNGGALFGRLIGQVTGDISPGIFAMVGAAAFLAGVSRMTVSLAVVMFELTGELSYVPAFMCAILTAKWVADAISTESVYDLSQHLQGHPFLDVEHAYEIVRHREATARELIPPEATMLETTVRVSSNYRVRLDVLAEKLQKLKARGLVDGGLVLVNESDLLLGYLPEVEIEYALQFEDKSDEVDIRSEAMAGLIEHTPITLSAEAPMEYVLELFGKLGPRYIIITEPETAKVTGVVLKKRLLDFLDKAKEY